MSAALPTGTVTFLFTDIEGSTDLLRGLGTDRYDEVLVEHGRLMRELLCSERSGGREVRVEGDSFFVVFQSAPEGVAAAAAVQRALSAREFPHGARVRVRMGLHTGEGRPAASEAGADYVGIDVHRAARIAAATHGGQVVISDATRSLVKEALPPGASLRPLGTHRLKDFAEPERLWQLVLEGIPDEFPPLRTLDRTPNNLPPQLTTFIGREKEIAEGVRLLGDGVRLLTLTGPGGTGKTRLSIEIASDLLERFGDGVYWVPLGPITDTRLVAPAIATSLGLQEAANTPTKDRVEAHLKDRAALLVIDNFEQLLPAAPLVGDLLRAAPKLRAIVTSRSPLHVYGEHEFPVPPLTLPQARFAPETLAQSEAARLFVERAIAVRPDFQVTPANASAIAEICARLDGLPLAIELAAARVKLLTPEQIVARLGKALDMLSAGARDLPDRQRTLRGAIAWSYDLLEPAARRLFERFAVFVGGADLEDIEAVCGPELDGDVLDVLMALVDHSLIRHRSAAATSRYQMLVVIREFALERLEAAGDAAAVRRRHAERYLALVEEQAPRIFGPEQRDALDRIERDHANVRAGVEWALASDATLAHRYLVAAWRFWQIRGHLQEGRMLAEQVLATSVPDERLRTKAIEAAAGIAYWQGDLAPAHAWYLETVERWRSAGDERELANALYNVAYTFELQDRFKGTSDSEAVLREALAIYERLDDERGKANVLMALVNTHGAARHYAQAQREAEGAIAVFTKLQDPFSLGWARHMAGLASAFLLDRPAAEAHWRDALRIFRDVGDLSAITLVLTNFSLLAMWDGDVPRAVRIFGASEALRQKSGAALASNAVDFLSWHADTLGMKHPGEAERAAHPDAWDEGRAMDAETAVAYALAGAPPA